MVADLSSSLGLFAIVWLALCALSSALVTDAMLRSAEAVPASGSNHPTLDGTDQNLGG